MDYFMTMIVSFLYRIENHIFSLGMPGRFAVSAFRSMVSGRIQSFKIDEDGDYINAQREGIVVSPVPHRTDFRKMRSRVVDYWFHNYTPRPGDTVIDVGAGIGEDTLVFAELVAPHGRIFSFEANPRTARCLAKTIQRSGLKDTESIAAAVTDRAGTILITDETEHVQNSLFVTDSHRSIEVPAVTLDDFIESRGIEIISFLKMNIEGAEVPALHGLRRNLGKVRNVAIACHDWIAELGHGEGYRTLERVTEILEAEGFILHRQSNSPCPWIRDTVIGIRRVE